MKLKLILLFCLCTTFTQSQFVVRGRVINEANDQIFAANVYIEKNEQLGVTTDFDGHFMLNINKKNNIIVVSFMGYQTKKIDLTKIEIDKELIIVLNKNQQTLNEVIISAEDPISEKFSVTKIEKLNIYFNPVAQADPLKAITILPASTTSDETANPSLRGSTADRTRVMLNGVPVYNPVRSSQLNNQGFFSIFNTEIIDKQYVYASNPPLIYGNSSAGLVEIQTLRKLPANQQSLSLSIGGLGFFVSQQLQQKEHNFLQLYGNYQFSEAFIGIQKKYVNNLIDFKTKDLGFNFHYRLNKNIEINSYNYGVNENYNVLVSNINYKGEAKADKKRFFTINNINYYTSKGIFSINTGFNKSSEKFDYGNIFSNKSITQVYSSFNYKHQVNEDIKWQTGISYDYHKNSFNDTIPLYFFALSPIDPDSVIKSNIEHHLIEGHLYIDYKISNKLFMSIGLRNNLPSNNQSHYLNAQLSVKYKFDKSHSILISGGKYNSFGTPSFYDKKFTQLSSKQFTVDYKYHKNKFKVNAAAYYKRETGQQVLDFYNLINKVKTLGLEAFVEYDINNNWKISASNLYIDQRLNKNDKIYHGNYDFNYMAKATLQYSNMKWFTAALSYIGRPGHFYTPIDRTIKIPNFKYTIPVFSESINSKQYKNYNKIDFSLNRYMTLLNGAVIIPFLSVTNILNIENQSTIYYDRNFSEHFFEMYSKRMIYFGIIMEL